MSVLYVNEQGSTVGIANERVQVRREKKVVMEIPALHVERVVLMVPAYLTQQAVRYFMDHGIDIVYMSQNGKFYGQFTRGDGVYVEQRLAQFRKFHDAGFRLKMARTFIKGKTQNMISVWQRQRRHGDLGSQIEALRRTHDKIDRAASLESLLGLEGSASAAHFRILRAELQGNWRFTSRIPHPPPDPVNAMLSLGYTLLYSRMSGLLQMQGLDPYLGFFHEPKRGHAALASDMIEEWRCPVVDALILRLVNNRQIAPRDFQINTKQCRMSQPALKAFIGAFEVQLKSIGTISVESDSGDPVGGMEGQVRQLARVLLGKQKEYVAVKG